MSTCGAAGKGIGVFSPPVSISPSGTPLGEPASRESNEAGSFAGGAKYQQLQDELAKACGAMSELTPTLFRSRESRTPIRETDAAVSKAGGTRIGAECPCFFPPRSGPARATDSAGPLLRNLEARASDVPRALCLNDPLLAA